MPTPATLEHEISPRLQKELRRHAGKWVATAGDKIVATGTTSTQVFRKAKKEGIEVPVIFRVPEADGSYFF